MIKIIVRVFLVHAFIAAAYLSYTNYRFVIDSQPNPVGTGIAQWFLMLIHFVVTLIAVGFLAKGPRIANRAFDWKLHGLIIVLIAATYLLVSKPLWQWLWSLRQK